MRLTPLDEVDSVQVKPVTGSVILQHASNPVSVNRVVAVVQSVVGEKTVGSGREIPQKAAAPHHVSNIGLVFSGIYIVSLLVKKIFFGLAPVPATVAARFFTLPALTALWLSLPIQRQAVEQFRKCGKPDMGLISTALLYLSIAMGKTLSALIVFWLYNVSNWIEARIQVRTRRAVREMLAEKATTVWLLRDGVEMEVALSSLVPGDVISLQKGSYIPVDGEIVQGTGIVNEAALTGESQAVEKEIGHTVFTGTVLEEGALTVRVVKTGEDARLAGILQLIEHAEQNMGELQSFSKTLSVRLVPYTLGLAGIALLITGNPIMAVTVLIVTCPCSLRLSTSATISAAMANGAGKGIYVKGGCYIETAGQADVLVLDKTGTLTEFVSEVHSVAVFNSRFTEREILQLAASAQKTWPHPLGRALIARAAEDGVARLPVEDGRYYTGRGVEGVIDGHLVCVGNAGFMEQIGVSFPPTSKSTDVLYVAVDKISAGLIEVGSPLRAGVDKALMQLKQIGFKRIVLLSGDVASGVRMVEDRLDFDEARSGQSPEDKAAWISDWKKRYPEDIVAMVGDGVNDTPAFAVADLSLAVGYPGADVAMEYADIVLHGGDAGQLVAAFSLGREAVRLIRQNHALAIGLNSVTLAAMLAGVLSPVAGVLVHNLITLGVVSNGSRILTYSD